MDNNLKDILSNLNPDIDQETLMLYLQDKLQGEQKHAVEQQLSSNEFDSDAMEGLQEMKDQRRISIIVDQLNRDLKRKTQRKELRRAKLKLPSQGWLIFAAVLILLLVVVSFLVLQRMKGR